MSETFDVTPGEIIGPVKKRGRTWFRPLHLNKPKNSFARPRLSQRYAAIKAIGGNSANGVRSMACAPCLRSLRRWLHTLPDAPSG